MENATKVLVDTCVLLDDPDVLVRILQKGGLPFLTSTVLDELDFNKRGEAPINRNAQMIFREFNRTPASKLTGFPTGESLLGQDFLTQFPFRGGSVFLVAREDFRTRSNNDAKIIELAKDYKMILITRDKGMKVRAEALGVDVAFWTGPGEPGRQQRGSPTGSQSPTGNGRPQQQAGRTLDMPQPFTLCTAPIDEADTLISIEKIPETGDLAKLSSGHDFRLGKLISA